MSLERAENSRTEQDSAAIGGGVVELLKGINFKELKQDDSKQPSLPELSIESVSGPTAGGNDSGRKPQGGKTPGPVDGPGPGPNPVMGADITLLNNVPREQMSPQQRHSMEHRPKDLPFLHELLKPNQPRENFEQIAEEAIKKELLTTKSREIAKTVGFDGTMSDNEKEQLAKDFEYAHKTGCEDEFVAAINEKLKNADKPFRIVIDKRQPNETDVLDRILKGETRTVCVVNADQGKIIDTHRFDVRHPLFIPSDQIPYKRPIEPFKAPPLEQK